MNHDPSTAFEGIHFSDLNRFSFPLQAVQAGTWDLDPKGHLVRWDDRCKELYGFSKEDQVTYEQVLTYIHPDDRSRVEQAVAWALNPASLGRYMVEFRTIGAEDGRLRWLHCQGQAYFNEKGEAYRFSGIAQNITALVEARQHSQSSDWHARNLVNSSGTATAVYRGREMRIQAVNQAMIDIWGKDGSVRGKTFDEAIPEVADQPFLALLQEVFDTGITHFQPEGAARLEVNGRLQEFWFTYTYVALRSESGDIYGVLHTATDITPQVQARKALEVKQKQFENLLQGSLILNWLFDTQGRVTFQNKRFYDFTGLSLEQSQSLGWQAFIHPDDYEHVQTVLQEGLSLQKNFLYENRLRRYDGQYCWHENEFVPLWDEQDQLMGWVCRATDIHAKKNLEGLVRERTQELAASNEALRVSNEALIVQTQELAASNEELQAASEELAQLNTQLLESERKYRLQALELQERTEELAASNEELQASSEELQERGEELLASNEELRASNEELQERGEELAASNEELQASGEELSESNQQLSLSNDRLQRFAYVASHDLQEPLRKIQTFSSLVSQKYATELGESGLSYLTRMSKAGEQMSKLIQDLLSYSRMNSQQDRFQVVSLQQILASVLDTLELSIQKTQAQIKIDLLPAVLGDELQLGQLFQNLLSNAIKFAKPGQKPIIHITSETKFREELPSHVKPISTAERFQQITVIDQGVGFDEQFIDRIFEVFQRLHPKEQYQGTGIGLAICQRVMENHGGIITAHSKPGQGASFCVYLPA